MQTDYLESRIQIPMISNFESLVFAEFLKKSKSPKKSDQIPVPLRVMINFDINAEFMYDPGSGFPVDDIRSLILDQVTRIMTDYYSWASPSSLKFINGLDLDSGSDLILTDSAIIESTVLGKLDIIKDLRLIISLTYHGKTIPIRYIEVDPQTGLRIDYVLDTSIIYQRIDGKDEEKVTSPENIRIFYDYCKKHCDTLTRLTVLWSEHIYQRSERAKQIIENGSFEQRILDEVITTHDYHIFAFHAKLRGYQIIFGKIGKDRVLDSQLQPWQILLLTVILGPIVTYLISNYLIDKKTKYIRLAGTNYKKFINKSRQIHRSLVTRIWVFTLIAWSMLFSLAILANAHSSSHLGDESMTSRWYDNYCLSILAGTLGNFIISQI